MKNKDFQILDKFADSSRYLVINHNIALGNNLSIFDEREHRLSRPHHWCLSLTHPTSAFSINKMCIKLHDFYGRGGVLGYMSNMLPGKP